MLEGFVKTINKSVWIASNQGQIKREFKCKKCNCTEFYASNIIDDFYL